MVRNKVILVGRLTRDIELRKTTSGKTVTSFSMAIQESTDKAIFVNCTAWEGSAELLAQYCKKGSQIAVEGHLIQRKWEERNVTLTEVMVESLQFLDSKREEQPAADPAQHGYTTPFTITDDELPF